MDLDLSKYLEEFDLDMNLPIQKVNNTLSGNVFYIGEDYILKIAKTDQQQSGLEKELQVSSILETWDIPHTQFIRISRDRKVLLMGKEQGIKIWKYLNKKDSNRVKDVYRELGLALAKLHSYSFDSYGALYVENNSLRVEGYSNIYDYLISDLRRIVKRLGKTALKDASLAVLRSFINSKELIIKLNPPQLIHSDLHPNNIFVRNNGEISFIDLDDFKVLHGEIELARIRQSHFKQEGAIEHLEMEKAYFEKTKQIDGFNDRKKLFDKFMNLKQAVRLLDIGLSDQDLKNELEKIGMVLGSNKNV